MPYRNFIPLLLLLSGIHSAAQSGQQLEADRPSESQSANTVDRRVFQVELGLRRERANPETVDWYQPRSVLRYGLFTGFELRAGINPVTERLSGQGKKSGLRPVELGFKAGLWKAKGVLPEAALFTQVGIPGLASEAFRPTYAQPRIRALFENELCKTVRLTYNLGAEWTGADTEPQWIYTFSPGFSIGRHWEAFTEVYGFLQRGSLPEHSFDAGFAFFIGSNMKADLSAGIGLSDAAPVNFAALGFSIKLGR